MHKKSIHILEPLNQGDEALLRELNHIELVAALCLGIKLAATFEDV
jgi:hypothetical protein